MSNLSTDLQQDDVKSQLSSLHKSVDNDPISDDVASPKIGSLARGVKQGKKLVMSRKQLDPNEGWVQELLLRSSNGFQTSHWVPKHLISVDEKYLRCCLEVIHISAFDAPSGLFNLNSLELGFFVPTITRRGFADAGKSFIDHPMETGGGGDIALSPVEQWVVGSITESDSMKSILRSPLFQRIGMLESASKFGMTDVTNNKRFLRPRLTGSSELTYTSSQKLEKDDTSVGSDLGYVSGSSIQRSPVSESSMDSMLIDQASCSCSYPRNYRAMLQCSWRGGLPHFEFSVDDQKELYVASPVNAQLAIENSPFNHVYVFKMKHGSSQHDESSGWNSEVIGKMKVSTSYTLCRCDSKVMETDFVFYGLGEIHGSESQSVSLRGAKHRKLSRVMELFKPSQLFKQRSNSRFGGSSTILEDHPEESQEVGSRSVCLMENTDPSLQSDFSPNRALAAVVVKHHVQEDSQQCREEEVGGWGLKFLKKAGMKQINPTPPASDSRPCGVNLGECASSTTDIILSAGIHGMPNSGNELPASIIERWKSGGACDCGGWDVGCPLTVLKTVARKEEGLLGSDRQNDCKSFNVFPEGSEQGTPILKMTNIHDGLYFVNFRSTVSMVQCFSVAVAMVLSQMPFLRPKQCTGLRLQEYL